MVEVETIRGTLIYDTVNKSDVAFDISGINTNRLNIHLEELDGDQNELSYTLRVDHYNTSLNDIIKILEQVGSDIMDDGQLSELTNFIEKMVSN